MHITDIGAILVQQEEEEWQEVLAQQDSFQQAAEPVSHAAQATGKAGNNPSSVQAPAALQAAQAQVSSDAVGRDSEGEAMQADAPMPATKDQPEIIMVSSTHLHDSGTDSLQKAATPSWSDSAKGLALCAHNGVC